VVSNNPIVTSHVSASRHGQAIALSVGLHGLVIATMVSVSFSIVDQSSMPSIDASLRWQQLQGDSPPRPGRNGLYDVLAAPDVVRVVLNPLEGHVPMKGLIWWSPSIGLWLAIDDAPAVLRGVKVNVELTANDRAPARAGTLRIAANGSARMISLGDARFLLDRTSEIVFVLTNSHAGRVVLRGSVAVGNLRR
jgi:hypothetical protein